MGWLWATSRSSDIEAESISPPRRNLDDNKVAGLFWAPKADIWAVESAKLPIAEPVRCPIDHSKPNYATTTANSGWFSGWFSAPSNSSVPKPPASAVARDSMASGCPVKHDEIKQPAGCPVKHNSAPPATDSNNSACPVDHAKFNKLNNIPHLAPSKLPGQIIDLPTERTKSSIPRGENDGEGFWEYPSPQQMLNAMVRKSGRDGIEEEAVESMVDVHNFLNEGVWQEVLDWEKPHSIESAKMPRLLKFQGRPGELTPKARMLQALGWIYPSKFGVPPPFDRHDWTVLRAVPGEQDKWQKVRYVIDFYEIPEENDEVPTFTVDVRPAVDSLGSIYDRARKAWGPTISQAMGW